MSLVIVRFPIGSDRIRRMSNTNSLPPGRSRQAYDSQVAGQPVVKSLLAEVDRLPQLDSALETSVYRVGVPSGVGDPSTLNV
jgi:hypothetical protein